MGLRSSSVVVLRRAGPKVEARVHLQVLPEQLADKEAHKQHNAPSLSQALTCGGRVSKVPKPLCWKITAI